MDKRSHPIAARGFLLGLVVLCGVTSVAMLLVLYGSARPAYAERVSFAAGDFNEQESYASDHQYSGGTVTTAVTTDTAGTLRLTRVGDLLTTYYWDGSDWQAMQSTTVYGTPELFIVLAAWTHTSVFDDVYVRLAFDNFKVNSGTEGTCP